MQNSVLIAAGLALVTVVASLSLSLLFSWGTRLQRSDWHHTHNRPIPRIGGLAIVGGFIVVESYIAWFHPELRARTPGRDAIVIGSLAMFALGFWDDLVPIRAAWKLIGQTLIAGTVCFCGVGIEVLTHPFTGSTIHLGLFGPVLTVVWLVSLTNLINLIDGADGLAGGICLLLMLLIAVIAHQNGNFELLASGMAGALAGFLCFNLPPARIYLGDGGAYFLGFQIALYAMVNSHKGTVCAALIAPLFALGLAITDAVLALARRGLCGLPLFRPDRKHLHHRLLAAGCSRRKVVLAMYGVNLVFFGMGLLAFWSRGEAVPVLLGAAVLLLFGCAASFQFSRRWFALHRIVRSSFRMRAEVQYALRLTQLMELETRRGSRPEELWEALTFAADKLGFAAFKVSFQDKERSWHRPGGCAGGARRCYQCHHNSSLGNLELAAPQCRLGLSGAARPCERDVDCSADPGGCLANPRLFEIISDLLAEAWNTAVVHWDDRRLPFRLDFQKKCL